MERLTTNENISDMGLVELALNCCYIAKDGSGRYRDYEIDMDERDFVRKLTTTLVGEDLPLQDESFDEEMMDNLGIDPFADVRGLIAIFYRNMWAMAELREKLKRYEDAEEQGLLLRLPCKPKSEVFLICSRYTRCSFEDVPFEESSCIGCENDCDSHKEIYIHRNSSVDVEWIVRNLNEFGKTVFLTKEKAKAKLAEMEGGLKSVETGGRG